MHGIRNRSQETHTSGLLRGKKAVGKILLYQLHSVDCTLCVCTHGIFIWILEYRIIWHIRKYLVTQPTGFSAFGTVPYR
jgi:hypothetical protein